MSQRVRIFVVLAFAILQLVPFAAAQKPPAPPSPAPSPAPTPNRPVGSSVPTSGPVQPPGELVMFLQGRVRTSDSTPVPHDVMVERICSNKVRQQVYTSPDGEFSMQLGAKSYTFLDASAEPAAQTSGTTNASGAAVLHLSATHDVTLQNIVAGQLTSSLFG